MNIPSFLTGESIVRLLQGTALGALAAMVVGFNWGGWTLGSTALKQADEQSKIALVSALAPICVEKFQSSTDAVANLAALNEETFYRRAGYIKEGGWAVMPGSEKASSGVAEACAKMLIELEATEA